MTLDQLLKAFRDRAVSRVIFKLLSPNDNIKNQPYFGSDLSVLRFFPHGEITVDEDRRGKRYKIPLDFAWISGENGQDQIGSGSQLILYPQYPEIRFSGFARGTTGRHREVMRVRDEGRVLVLGISDSGRIYGFTCFKDDPVAEALRSIDTVGESGIFFELQPLGKRLGTELELLATLREVHNKGWIESKRLNSDGEILKCNASNCGGYTLEAELGIRPNGIAEPDFLGWEVKAHSVSAFGRRSTKAVTLMTPEPSIGQYKSEGAEWFIWEYGYEDIRGRPNRLNFSSPHRIGERNDKTGLTLRVHGFDSAEQKVTDADGCVALLNDNDEIAAGWPFAHLLTIWSTKHAKAVYIPYLKNPQLPLSYCYGAQVQLCEGTNLNYLLRSIDQGSMYYDPGIKLENATSPDADLKKRSQFRIGIHEVGSLYKSRRLVDMLD